VTTKTIPNAKLALLVECPVCGRGKGERCNSLHGWNRMERPHQRRTERALIEYGGPMRYPDTRTYAFGVRWIAVNDEPGVTDPDEMEGLISVMLLADLCGKDPAAVADDVCRYRVEHGVES
jgi:hypothetical protein